MEADLSIPKKLDGIDKGHAKGEDASTLMSLLTTGDYVSGVDPMTYLTVLSKEEAYRRWDYYGSIGKYKNKLFKPLTFPDLAIYLNNSRHYFVSLPCYLDRVKPIEDIRNNSILIHVKDTTGINIGAESEWIKIE